MESLSQHIAEIKVKLEKLLTQHSECKEANADLRDENERLESLLSEREQEIEDLQNKIKILKLAKNISGEETGEKTELKRKINEYIREIDRCIAMLND